MIELILFFAHSALLLLFGVYLSACFAGIKITKKNFFTILSLCAFSGILQIGSYVVFSEETVWKLYPVITHLPLIIFMVLVYHKRVITAAVSVFTAYLCCQPAKWFGLLIFYITDNTIAEYIARISILVIVAYIIFQYLAENISEVFNKDIRTVCIFGLTPAFYYAFDYMTGVYTDVFKTDGLIVTEFMPFFLCLSYMLFCFVYYKEYEQKSDAERKEQIISLTVEEQKREIEAIRRSEQETRRLRHDMRLLLNNLLVSIDNNDKETAKKMVSSYVDAIETATVKRYCNNTTINYIISSYAQKCLETQIEFEIQINFENLDCDEIMLSTVIANALDNAINAQNLLSSQNRKINLMIKEHNGKLLLSVKNPIKEKPVFVNGVPVTNRKGHGYGTQSIIYLTERMGGNCQFTTEDDYFILRIII